MLIRQAGDRGQLYGSVSPARHRRRRSTRAASRSTAPGAARQGDQDHRPVHHPGGAASRSARERHHQRRPQRGRSRAPGARRGRAGREDRSRKKPRSPPRNCSRKAPARRPEGEEADGSLNASSIAVRIGNGAARKAAPFSFLALRSETARRASRTLPHSLILSLSKGDGCSPGIVHSAASQTQRLGSVVPHPSTGSG